MVHFPKGHRFSSARGARLHALFFLPLHFFLALLERRFNVVIDLLEFRARRVAGVRQKHCFVLPARLARLSRAIAVILVRESAALLPASGPVAARSPRGPGRTRHTSRLEARWMRTLGGPHSPQIAPTDFFSVEAGKCFRCFRIVGHFHKCESAGSSRFTVRRNVDTRICPNGSNSARKSASVV